MLGRHGKGRRPSGTFASPPCSQSAVWSNQTCNSVDESNSSSRWLGSKPSMMAGIIFPHALSHNQLFLLSRKMTHLAHKKVILEFLALLIFFRTKIRRSPAWFDNTTDSRIFHVTRAHGSFIWTVNWTRPGIQRWTERKHDRSSSWGCQNFVKMLATHGRKTNTKLSVRT
jgi:hypothetical protein